jgi:hypothetical protein
LGGVPVSANAEAVTAPSARQRRIQSAIDSGAALVLAMLAWPFPLARAMLPVAVNIASIIVFWQVIQVLYFVVTVGVWRQTGGMRLQGLTLRDRDGQEPPRGQRVMWAAIAGVLTWAQVAAPAGEGNPTLAERVAKVRVFVA